MRLRVGGAETKGLLVEVDRPLLLAGALQSTPTIATTASGKTISACQTWRLDGWRKIISPAEYTASENQTTTNDTPSTPVTDAI